MNPIEEAMREMFGGPTVAEVEIVKGKVVEQILASDSYLCITNNDGKYDVGILGNPVEQGELLAYLIHALRGGGAKDAYVKAAIKAAGPKE